MTGATGKNMITSGPTPSAQMRVEVKFQIWIAEQVRPCAPDDDPKYLFESIFLLLDNDWASILREQQECEGENMKTIFQAMDNIMLIKYPISNRRIAYTRMQMEESKNPSNFMRRIQLVVRNMKHQKM